MLARFRSAIPSLALLGVLGCGTEGTGAGDVLIVAEVEISPPVLALADGTTAQLEAIPRTSSGIVIPNRQASWSSDDPGVASVSEAGVVTGVSAGSTHINATIDDVRARATVEVTPRPVASVNVDPAQLTLLVGETGNLTVTARDAVGEPLPDRPVTFSSDNPLIATVSESGQVAAVSTGLTVITATVEGKSGTANVMVTSLPATQLEFQNQPSTGAAGSPIPAVRVEVQNSQGGMVREGGIPVTISLADNPTDAVLSGTLTVNAVNGVATFNDIRINEAGVGYTLRASSGTLASALSAPFAVVAGTASRLTIATQPSAAATSGVPLAVQPGIQIRDAGDNAVAQAGVMVTVALEGAGATLGGTASVATDAQGIATFTGLVITGSAGVYTLLFAAPGLIAIASDGITLAAGAPASLIIVQQPAATAQSGVPLERQPVLQLEDVDGNIVTQAGIVVTATIQSGGGALGGAATVMTGADGRATFTNLSITGFAGPRVLQFNAGSVAPVASEPVVVLPGPPAALVIVIQPPGGTASGDVLSPAPAVQVVDAVGNAVGPEPEMIITAAIASGTGGTLGGTTSVTTVGGLATFSGLILSGPAGSFTLSFSGGGLTPAVSQAITIGPPPPTALAIVTQPASSAQSGVSFTPQPVIELRDGSGAPVSQSGIQVTAAIASGEGSLGGTTTRTTDASGRAAFTDLVITGNAGQRTLRFSATGLSDVTSSVIEVTVAPQASRLVLAVAPSASATSGAAFSTQPAVQIVDANGTSISQSGATITAEIASGPTGATLSNATATSNASGRATFSGLAITGPAGTYVLRFESGSLTPVSSGNIALSTGAAGSLSLTTQPATSAVSGEVLSRQPVVQVRDGSGSAVSQSGIAVTASIASGGGTLGGTTTRTTGANGQAAFNDLEITGSPGPRTLRFSATGLTGVTSGTIDVRAAEAASLSLTTQPAASAMSGEVLTRQPVVQVRDGSGNAVSRSGIAVTASIASGGGTLGGTTTRTTGANGQAAFTDLEITGSPGPRTLRFSATGLAGVTSGTINITAPPAARLVLATQPSSSASSGAPLSTQPSVQVADAGGDPVASAGRTVTAVIASGPGGGTLSNASAVSDASGRATFEGLSITGLVGVYTLRFQSGFLTSVTSGSISLGAGAPASITLATQPPATARSAERLAGSVVVQVQDAAGNNVSGAAVTASVASGPGQLQGTLTRSTGSTGRATFDDLTLVGESGSYTLRFSTGGISVVSRTITLENLEGQNLFIITQPPSDAERGKMLSRDPRVEIRDKNGNRVAVDGVTITVALETISGSGSLGGDVARETSNGVATWTNLKINGAGRFRLRFSTPGREGVTSSTIDVRDH